MLDCDLNLATKIEQGIRVEKINPFRSRYIRLCNLQTLLEFCIPVIQDYGVALKGNDWPAFSHCFMSMLLFFVMCNGTGALHYQRSLYCFTSTLPYWTLHKLPIIKVLQANHTLFSEETGEIALSVLSTSQPINNRTKIEQGRKAWQFVRTRYNLHKSVNGLLDREKKHRISKCRFSITLDWIIL